MWQQDCSCRPSGWLGSRGSSAARCTQAAWTQGSERRWPTLSPLKYAGGTSPCGTAIPAALCSAPLPDKDGACEETAAAAAPHDNEPPLHGPAHPPPQQDAQAAQRAAPAAHACDPGSAAGVDAIEGPQLQLWQPLHAYANVRSSSSSSDGTLPVRSIGRLVCSAASEGESGPTTPTARAAVQAPAEEKSSPVALEDQDAELAAALAVAAASAASPPPPVRVWRSAQAARLELFDAGAHGTGPRALLESAGGTPSAQVPCSAAGSDAAGLPVCVAGLRKGARCWLVYAQGGCSSHRTTELPSSTASTASAASASPAQDPEGVAQGPACAHHEAQPVRSGQDSVQLHVCEAGVVATQVGCYSTQGFGRACRHAVMSAAGHRAGAHDV